MNQRTGSFTELAPIIRRTGNAQEKVAALTLSIAYASPHITETKDSPVVKQVYKGVFSALSGCEGTAVQMAALCWLMAYTKDAPQTVPVPSTTTAKNNVRRLALLANELTKEKGRFPEFASVARDACYGYVAALDMFGSNFLRKEIGKHLDAMARQKEQPPLTEELYVVTGLTQPKPKKRRKGLVVLRIPYASKQAVGS